MSTPSWWSDALLEPQDSNISISDVETGGVGIITKVREMLVTNGNWSEISANFFLSPLTAAGKWIAILFTRIDADTMEVRVSDYLSAVLITRRFDINVAPASTAVEFYCGNNYLHIWTRRATAEGFFAYLLDPEVVGGTDAEIPNRLVANAQRNTAGTATAITTGTAFAFDNGAAATDGRMRVPFYVTAGSTTAFVGSAGRELYYPYTKTINQSGVETLTGCAPGMALAGNAIATDTVKNIPVDTGTKLAFVALPMTVTATYGGKGMVRKPSVDP